MKTAMLFSFLAVSVVAQTNPVASDTGSNSPARGYPSAGLRAEKTRADCIQGRRIICGQILKVMPGGLVVDSGYTNLWRPPWNRSWLIPGSVVANRPASQVESRESETVCVGVVFLTDIPKSRGAGAKPRPYDYVRLLAYPTGQYTYTSAGTIQKTVRRFSANLAQAVNANLDLGVTTGANAPAGIAP